jgi:hypothetical protein
MALLTLVAMLAVTTLKPQAGVVNMTLEASKAALCVVYVEEVASAQPSRHKQLAHQDVIGQELVASR